MCNFWSLVHLFLSLELSYVVSRKYLNIISMISAHFPVLLCVFILSPDPEECCSAAELPSSLGFSWPLATSLFFFTGMLIVPATLSQYTLALSYSMKWEEMWINITFQDHVVLKNMSRTK